MNKFEIALRMRDFEITQLSQRNNFFMIFQGVLFSGLIQSSCDHGFVSLMVSLAGLAAAMFQAGMASGAKFWQEYWEQKVSDFEPEMINGDSDDDLLFHSNKDLYIKTVEKRLCQPETSGQVANLVLEKYSVSRIPIYIGIIFSLIWTIISVYYLTKVVKF